MSMEICEMLLFLQVFLHYTDILLNCLKALLIVRFYAFSEL